MGNLIGSHFHDGIIHFISLIITRIQFTFAFLSKFISPTELTRHTQNTQNSIQKATRLNDSDVCIQMVSSCTIFSYQFHFNRKASIGDDIVDTLYSTSENKIIHTPPPFPLLKVKVFVGFYRQLEQQHNIAPREWGRESFIFSC